ncbi:molybdenum ABC transporter permease [Mucilaginibacter conchicola]|uniref:Molybdenum ABC transporter permease n=1 Tax=Mucilaginibacter conchicola TaxID=2303333 RepID=A0A372NMU4_9SPHI|nr:molybdenum ABC transporter permease [Mucilaginibacter conchicola]RFZ90256.1 molybdenum ABC transporter permease [Mucilaginibacter conchicola]
MKVTQTYTTIAGVLLVALGLLIRYAIGRRRFYRRNFAGLQTFSGYKRALLISLAERLGMWFANACIIAGGLLLAATQIIHHKF